MHTHVHAFYTRRQKKMLPVEISQSKELPFLVSTDMSIGIRQRLEIWFQVAFHWIIVLIGTDTSSTEH